MIDRPQSWSLPELAAYLETTLRRMAENRDVRADGQGEPLYDVKRAGRKADGSLRIDFIADLSGIGMPVNAPLAVVAEPGNRLVWLLGEVVIATTSEGHSPEQAGYALGMDRLLAAHRTWVGRSGGSRGR